MSGFILFLIEIISCVTLIICFKKIIIFKQFVLYVEQNLHFFVYEDGVSRHFVIA